MTTSYEVPFKRVDANGVEDGQALALEAQRLGSKVRSRLVHAACVMYQANLRRGTHSTRGRSELKYSNRKPWRQKGTGRARAGTRRSPLWRGGGTIFGPKPRDYSYSMPKKARWRATQSALLSKFRDGEATVVEALGAASGKTREVAGVIKALGLAGERVLLVHESPSEMLVRACRNLADVKLMRVGDLNAFELIRNKRLVMTRVAYERALEIWGEGARAEAEES